LSVDLAAFENPITNLMGVIQTAAMNAAALRPIIAADPMPIRTQVTKNQIANAALIKSGVQNASMSLASGLMGLPAQLQAVLADLKSGDIFDAVQQLAFEIPLGLLLGPLLELTTPFLTIAAQTTQNIANATSVLQEQCSGSRPRCAGARLLGCERDGD
jgi:hypothetical protein